MLELKSTDLTVEQIALAIIRLDSLLTLIAKETVPSEQHKSTIASRRAELARLYIKHLAKVK